jgi:hypothetical protein
MKKTIPPLSFLAFCIEFYVEHTHTPSPEVYRLFVKTGLLDMLVSDYEDLHGMSFEYLMQFFDEYLEPETYTNEQGAVVQSHSLIKATIIPDIIKLIAEKYTVSEQKALDVFYTSATAASLDDDETGLYGQSPLYIFSLLVEEMAEKSVTEKDGIK